MNWIALLAAVVLAGCDASAAPAPTMAPAPVTAAIASREIEMLAGKSLSANSLPEIRLLSTAGGRAALANVVACALPAGASISAIAADGTPYSFAGRDGLASGWIGHAPTAGERQRVASCVHAKKIGG
jgi:hypothetical protein